MNNEWVQQQQQQQSVAANQNSTSSIQITLFVNRFVLKGRHLLLLETCTFSMAALSYRNTQQNSVEKVAYKTRSLDYTTRECKCALFGCTTTELRLYKRKDGLVIKLNVYFFGTKQVAL